VTAEDLKRYEPIWTEPFKEPFSDTRCTSHGPPHLGAQSLFTGLNLAEVLKLDQKGPYWTDPATFQALAPYWPVVTVAPLIGKRTADLLRRKESTSRQVRSLGRTTHRRSPRFSTGSSRLRPAMTRNIRTQSSSSTATGTSRPSPIRSTA